MSALVDVRESTENLAFRRELDSSVAALSDVELLDVDKVAGEIATAMSALLDKHDAEAAKLARDAETKHRKTALLAGAAVTLAFSPALAAVIGGATPFAVLGKYLYDKIDERAQKRTLSRSLLGVLARARARGRRR